MSIPKPGPFKKVEAQKPRPKRSPKPQAKERTTNNHFVNRPLANNEALLNLKHSIEKGEK